MFIDEELQEKALALIAEGAGMLGWSVGFSSDPQTDAVNYMVLGKRDYVAAIGHHLGEELDILDAGVPTSFYV